MKASVIFWYGESTLRSDGGGARALAWLSALRGVGYTADIVPIDEGLPHRKSFAKRILSETKQRLLPVPLRRLPPSAEAADIIINAVPVTFQQQSDRDKTPRILDWMDCPSTIADSYAKEASLGGLGANFQRRQWLGLEDRLQRRGVHAYASWNDFARASRHRRLAQHIWLPNPITVDPQYNPECGDSIGMLANFNYRPNREGLERFLSKYERALKISGFKLILAGYGSSGLSGLPADVEVMGEVQSPREFYERVSRVIVPIYTGGGIKIKAVEAMCYQVPVFGDIHVLDGLPSHLRKHIHPLGEAFVATSVEAPRPDELNEFSSRYFQASVAALLHNAIGSADGH